MAGRALKQTGSRSIEAALEYISKMGYLDPRNEQIVRVIKQTSPGEPRPAAWWAKMVCGLRTTKPCAEGSNLAWPGQSQSPGTLPHSVNRQAEPALP